MATDAAHPPISGREWRRVLIFGVLLMLLTLVPYLLGALTASDESVFSGFLFGVQDGSSYMGKMRLGVQGDWAFTLFYTPQPHDPAPFIFLPYIVPGQLIGLAFDPSDPALPAAMRVTYHTMRVIFGVLLIAVLYAFAAAFLRQSRDRFLALIFMVLGGGLGWLLIAIGELPPELYIPEWFTFFLLLALPHLALARAALIGGFLLLMGGYSRDRWAVPALLAGLSWLISGMAVPFYLAVIYAVLGAWGLAAWLRDRAFPWRLFRAALLAGAVTLPYFAYNLLLFTADPFFAGWSAQNLLATPPPLHVVLAYLPLGLLAIIGARAAWRLARADGRWALLIGWPVIVPILIYLPLNVQRRLAESVIVALGVLAALGVSRLADRVGGWRRVAIPAVIITSSSSFVIMIGSLLVPLDAGPPVMHPATQVAALHWLDDQSAADAIALSAYDTGNILPVYTNLRPFVGHTVETVNADARIATVEQFFSGALTAAERAALYAADDVRYIIYGPAERELAGDTPPNWLDDAAPIYEADDYSIYQVLPAR
jgi:hypothetical protein